VRLAVPGGTRPIALGGRHGSHITAFAALRLIPPTGTCPVLPNKIRLFLRDGILIPLTGI